MAVEIYKMHSGLFWIVAALLVLIGWCVHRIVRRGMTRATMRDWLLYIGAGILVILAVLLSAYSDIETEAAMRWFVPVITGAFALGYPARESWDFTGLQRIGQSSGFSHLFISSSFSESYHRSGVAIPFS
jgi:hypothetical protein